MGGNRASNKQIKVGVNDIVAGDNIDVVDSNGSITVSTDSDMSKSTYDPTAKNSDSFDMDNMDEGANTKILTSSERTNIATNTTKISYTDSAAVATNTAKVGITPTQASDITSNNSKISYTDAAVVSTNASDIDTLELNNTGTNTGDQDISGISTNAGNISTNEGNINNNAIDINTLETNNTGVNTGDQDLSSLATKANVLELDNTTSFTPNADYEPATKKYVDDSTSDVTKIIGGNGITVSPGNGLGDVTINLDGSTGDYTEWATYIGTRAGQDLVVTIGDYDSAGNGTSIKVNDALQKIIASKLIQAENGIESDANNGVILNNLANDGKVTFKASNISSGDDINLEVQDVSGVIALISDISGIAINAGDIATNTGDILTLQTNNTGVNTGDQDVSGIAINASAINTLETNNTGVNTGDQDVSGIAVNAGDILTLETNNTGVNTGDQDISGIAVNASAINTLEINNTGVNTGDQDVSGFAEKTNVLELDNTDIFVPTTDYMPATKKYVDDSNGVASVIGGNGITVSDSGGNVTVDSDAYYWAELTGVWGTNGVLRLGDWNDDGNSTQVHIDDENRLIKIVGDALVNGDITSYIGNLILDDGVAGYKSTIQSGTPAGNIILTLPTIAGTIALTSDIANVISDDAYDADWNGVTNIAPSQNALYDKMEQFLTSSNLQETLDSGSSAVGADTYTTVDISIEGASAFSFEKTDAVSDINYGVDSNSIYSSLFNQLNDSLSSVLAINGEVQLVTSNVADGQSKTILNIPTAATDGFEFQVNVPRPTLVADTEITMPISINNNFADANGNLNIAVEGGVQTIIAGAGIAISPPGGIGNVIITSTVVGTTPVTNKGDLYTYDTDVAALAVGTNDQVLTVDLSEPTGLKWADASAGSVLTTSGDILHYTTQDERLGIGTASQVLTVNAGGTDVEWADTSESSPLLTDGDLYYYNDGNARLQVGDVGQVLTVDVSGYGLEWAYIQEDQTFDDVLKAGNYAYSDSYISSIYFQLSDYSPYTEIALESYSSGNKSKIYSDDEVIELSISSNSFSTDHSIEIDYEGPRLTAGLRGSSNAATSLLMSTPGSVADVEIRLLAPSNAVANADYQIPLSVNGVFCDGDGDITIAAGSSPLTTQGDILHYTTQDERLGIGTASQVLTVNAAGDDVEWADIFPVDEISLTGKSIHVTDVNTVLVSFGVQIAWDPDSTFNYVTHTPGTFVQNVTTGDITTVTGQSGTLILYLVDDIFPDLGDTVQTYSINTATVTGPTSGISDSAITLPSKNGELAIDPTTGQGQLAYMGWSDEWHAIAKGAEGEILAYTEDDGEDMFEWRKSYSVAEGFNIGSEPKLVVISGMTGDKASWNGDYTLFDYGGVSLGNDWINDSFQWWTEGVASDANAYTRYDSVTSKWIVVAAANNNQTVEYVWTIYESISDPNSYSNGDNACLGGTTRIQLLATTTGSPGNERSISQIVGGKYSPLTTISEVEYADNPLSIGHGVEWNTIDGILSLRSLVAGTGTTITSDKDYITINSTGLVAPASATDTGTAGEIRVVSGFLYTCVATDTWERTVTATW